MVKVLAVIALLLLFLPAQAQESKSDYLESDFHKARRAAVRLKMPANSVAVFFTNPVRNRSNDVEYIYHQDPNFYYLTGHKEPHSVLLIFKEKQRMEGVVYDEIIFVWTRNALKELYNGERLGKERAGEKLDIAIALEGPDFKSYNLDFSRFDKVLFYDFFNDVRDTSEEGDLFELISEFKRKVNYDQSTSLNPEPKRNNLDMQTIDRIMVELRGIKTPEELDLLRKAVNISAAAQAEVMRAMKPGLSETEIQGIHEFIFKKYRAEYEGYPSIVGAGHNGCVLHYIDNYKAEIEDGELILMDLGAEYHGYTADVTRTIPVNGKFTKEQKLIYDLVYEAQEAAWEICRPGTTFEDLYLATADVVNSGLVKLGLYKSTMQEDIMNWETGRNRYYPHGCCHHIGLDVHDKGEYNVLKENMVITIEPGIYIPDGSPADKKWWDIPVRIEDDFLVTKDGCELLSDMAPRKSDEIEELMKETSLFNDLVLPDIDKR